jgi:hypothetical protein
MSNIIKAENKFKEREIVSSMERISIKIGIDPSDPIIQEMTDTLIYNHRIIDQYQ